MTELRHLEALLWQAILHSLTVQPVGHHADGFLIGIIGAIIGIFQIIGSFVLEAAQLVFDSANAAIRFAVRGVAWLTGHVRALFSDIFDGLSHTFGAISRWLGNLYCAFRDLKQRLENFFSPVIDFLKKVRQWYDLVWKKVISPVLNIMQRIRKVLAIFKFFHLKWAVKLDADLAFIQGKIASNFTLVRSWLNTVTSWVDLLVDPFGALRIIPLFAGILNGVNLFFAGVFGSPFQWGGENAGVSGTTTHVSVSMGQSVQDIRNNTGDFADIRQYQPGVASSLYSEMGVALKH